MQIRKRYKLLIAYDGTDYVGWGEQPNQPTIVQTMKDTFQRIFNAPVSIAGASRTDAGVHALGQVAIIETDLAITPEKMMFAWNNVLPSSILIRSLEPAENFYPRAKVFRKIYWYHIFPQRPLPFYARYGWWHPQHFDLELFKKALQLFIGTHDFYVFYKGDRQDTIRTIDQISVEYVEQYGCYRVEIIGERFLRHMIRRMVGTAMMVATRNDFDISLIEKSLKVKKNHCELFTAPPQGLLLHSIAYKD